MALDTPFQPLPPAVADAAPPLVEELVAALLATSPDTAWARDDRALDRMRPRNALMALLTIRFRSGLG